MAHKKISLVIAARNDDYGGNFANRMRTSIRVLAELAKQYSASFELVIVEYAPPENKPPIATQVSDISHEALPIRIITVPTSFHHRVAKSSKNPFLEYVAKNIGIRRAQGEFIIAMNPDIIFSASMVQFLAQGTLNAHTVYRANRSDLSLRFIDETLPVSDVLALCQAHVTRTWTPHGQLYTSWVRWGIRMRNHLSPRSILRNLRLAPIFNTYRTSRPTIKPHDAAAGDFIMAHRDAWTMVRGYDQEPINSYTDGYNLHMFHVHGYKQCVLKEPIYHINHTASNSKTFQLPFQKYQRDTQQMLRTNVPYKIYDEHWGFPEEYFSEQNL
jgi:hypothetical protein